MRYGISHAANALLTLTLFAAATSAPGCSLFIDSDAYVAQEDAGPDQGGPPDGSIDASELDQGGMCGGDTCAAGEVCFEDTVCGILVSSCDPSTCTLGGCDDDPLGSSSKLCFPCDNDGDGFPSALIQCSLVAERLPRDCDDNNAQIFPEEPRCGDNQPQGCPLPAIEELRAALGSDVVELGRLPILGVQGLSAGTQLSTVVQPPYLAGDDLNAARWLFGFVRAGEAELQSYQFGGFGPAVRDPWRRDPAGGQLRRFPTWPFLDGGTLAFVLAVGRDGGLRLAATGIVQNEGDGLAGFLGTAGGIELGESILEPGVVDHPLAIIGDDPHVVRRFNNGTTLGLRSFALGDLSNQQQTAGEPSVNNRPGLVLDAAGEYVLYNTRNNSTAELWDGRSSVVVPIVLDPSPTVPMTGAARVARVPDTDTFLIFLPYSAGLRVVEFACTSPGGCQQQTIAGSIELPALSVFDVQIFNDLIVIIHVQADKEVVLDMFTPEFARLTPAGGILLMSERDMPVDFSRFSALETDIQLGMAHREIVIGALAETTTGTNTLMATGFRACTAP